MSGSLHFKNLKVGWFYGTRRNDPEFKDFSGSINILYGPNGSGKTTASHALQTILWPGDSVDDRSPYLLGEFQVEQDTWKVNVSAGSALYTVNGHPTEAPPLLPPAGNRDRYRLALPDLLSDSDNDRDLAREIQKEINGGFDLKKAGDEAGFHFRSPTNQLNKKVRDARTKIKERRNTIINPVEKERELDEVNKNLELAKKKSNEITKLNELLKFRESKNNFDTLDERYRQFDPLMERINGDELESIRELDADIMNTEQELEKAGKELDDARQRKAASGLGHINKDRLGEINESCEEYYNKINDAENNLNIAKRDYYAACEREKSARDRIGENLTDAQLENIDVYLLHELGSGWLRDAEDFHGLEQEIKHLKSLLDNTIPMINPGFNIDNLNKGVDYLHQWLRHEDISAWRSRVLHPIMLIGSILMVPFIVILGIKVSPLYFIALVLPVVLAVMAVIHLLLVKNRDRTSFRDAYNGLDLPSQDDQPLPDEWDETFVNKLLGKLQEIHAQLKLKDIVEMNIKPVLERCQDDAQEKKKRLEEIKESIIKKAGITPVLEAHWLAGLIEFIKEWFLAHQELLESNKRIEALDNEYREYLKKFNELLRDTGSYTAENAAAAAGIKKGLNDRINKLVQAETDINTWTREINRLIGEKNKHTSARKKIFEVLYKEYITNEEKMIEKLRELIPGLEEFKKIKAERAASQAVLTDSASELGNYQIEPGMMDLPIDEIRDLLEEAREHDVKKPDFSKRQGKLEIEIQLAKKERVLEEALGKYADALENLKEIRHEICMAHIGHELVEYIGKQADRNASRVLSLAEKKMADITRHKYQLKVRGSEFLAWETHTSQDLRLSQLSSGTRAQLLIAVRTAFIENLEQQNGLPRLPLILDETLANSDDRRARDIINAVINLIKEGRQVFYLTAQSDEVGKWKAALAAENIPVRQYDLPLLDQAPRYEIEIQPQQRPGVPKPGRMTYKEYGKTLGVPTFDPWAEQAGVHLWHILESTHILFILLKEDYTTWGQLESLLTRQDALAVLDITEERFSEKVRARAGLLSHMVRLWQSGRGKPVGDREIIDSGEVSKKFLNGVLTLVQQCKGDAEAVIEELRNGALSRFQSNAIEGLESWMKENGYIDNRPRLSRQKVKSELLAISQYTDCLSNPCNTINSLLDKVSW
jgi:energy-coupling factor transporter ATP-binding protein EcfA2